VIRDIHDPVGVGTDHDGQLPVVATARYSPPEYLFRLLPPSSELWHALTVYQLGALLHDLIMRRPLFQSEYLESRENRYRFAWLVATAVPKVQADDVDQDLVFTARRALDKDWQQRSSLELEDFLEEPRIQQAHALQLLGLAPEETRLCTGGDVGANLRRITEAAINLENEIADRLRKQGATAQHFVMPAEDDYSKKLIYRWIPPIAETSASSESIELQATLSLRSAWGRSWFKSAVTLHAVIDGGRRQATLALPDVEDGPAVESDLADQIESSLAVLAVEVNRPRAKIEEE
jgi:hypothetical protein